MAKMAKILPKVSIPLVWRMNVTDDRQTTDDRLICGSKVTNVTSLSGKMESSHLRRHHLHSIILIYLLWTKPKDVDLTVPGIFSDGVMLKGAACVCQYRRQHQPLVDGGQLYWTEVGWKTKCYYFARVFRRHYLDNIDCRLVNRSLYTKNLLFPCKSLGGRAHLVRWQRWLLTTTFGVVPPKTIEEGQKLHI